MTAGRPYLPAVFYWGPKTITAAFIKRPNRRQTPGNTSALSSPLIANRTSGSRMERNMIGWWGCVACGRKVSNDHKGPCAECGGRVRRMVSQEDGAVQTRAVSMSADEAEHSILRSF